MNKLIIVADLGRVRVFSIKKGSVPEGIPDHLGESEEGALDVSVETRSGTVTDQSGRFGQGNGAGGAGGMSYGEGHHLDAELERKNLDRIAAHISQVVEKAGCPPIVLAAPQAAIKRLETALSRKAQDAIINRVGADLTKEPISKLEKRFLQS